MTTVQPSTNLPRCNFRVIGLRMHHSKDKTKQTLQVVRSMQKSFYGHSEWIYFYHDKFCFSSDDRTMKIEEGAFDDGYIFNAADKTISISAIVGKNGSGKSTLIDMMIRVLNNVSACVFGEQDYFPAARHLHFIDHVYASLAVYVEQEVKVISVQGRSVQVYTYAYDLHEGLYKRDDDRTISLLTKDASPDSPIGPRLTDWRGDDADDIRQALMFYTSVYNYSLYAFNYRDYLLERTCESRLTADDRAHEENRYWLKGVFYKNDGYQTPIVINPMRVDGCFNVNKENALAKERLLSLLFYRDADQKYPFRVINDDLQVVGLTFKEKTKEAYNREYVCRALGLEADDRITEEYADISEIILSYWSERYGYFLTQNNRHQSTCNYVVYKTLKIAHNYKKYESLLHCLEGGCAEKEQIEVRLDELNADYSHVTLKLRRALNFLQFSESLPFNGRQDLGILQTQMDEVLTIMNNGLNDFPDEFPLRTIDELLPPPSIAYEFHLAKKDCPFKGRRSELRSQWIPFEGLSSGERQIAYTISNVMYHLVNINSVWKDYNDDIYTHSDLCYKYVNVVFDELELYFHPELQRMFLKYVISALRDVKLEHIKGVNILLVTHSPFVISDLPESNILFLTPKDQGASAAAEKPIGQTFGANIYDMLNHHFFLGQSIGQIAEDEIRAIVEVYNETDTQKRRVCFEQNRQKYRYIQHIIGDKYIGQQIAFMIERMEQKYNPAAWKAYKIAQLRTELEKLQGGN